MVPSRLLLTFVVSFCAVAVRPAGAQTLPDPTVLDRVLGGYVRDGLVDYGGLAADRRDLDDYLDQLGRTSPTDLEIASRDARLAFWINAFNACVLQLVLEHYPLKGRGSSHPNSVRQIRDAWTRQFCRVAQRERSLDGIVHGVLRPLGEPRMHFAVACPSRSCPPLASEAYRGGDLDRQLDAAVARFLADSSRYELTDGTPPTLRVNKFLDWYKEDFGGTGGMVAFLRRFASPDQARILYPGRVRVEYFEYDWTLNDAAGPPRQR